MLGFSDAAIGVGGRLQIWQKITCRSPGTTPAFPRQVRKQFPCRMIAVYFAAYGGCEEQLASFRFQQKELAMSIKCTLVRLSAALFIFSSFPGYAGDIISCNGFESCPASDPTIAELVARMDALEAENEVLKTLLAGVSRGTDPNTSQDTLTFTGMNVQVVSGSGATDETVNGTGNLIIGYNETGNSFGDDRTGSHMLVVGRGNSYTSFGGMVVGQDNTASGQYASVSGGWGNKASGFAASVSGGGFNTASVLYASVSGGYQNEASGPVSSISGGQGNKASGYAASVSGGDLNTASGELASVSGGNGNTASGYAASVSGGTGRNAGGNYCTEGDSRTDC
jgi:hypothetical protein